MSSLKPRTPTKGIDEGIILVIMATLLIIVVVGLMAYGCATSPYIDNYIAGGV